jgi:hypothetical protein
MQVNFKKIISLTFVFFLTFQFSLLSAPNQNTQNQSSIDIKSVQSRIYNDPYKDVFRSVLAALQNNKFKIKFTDMAAGVISADGTPEAAENMSEAASAVGSFFIPFFGVLRKEKQLNWSISTNIEELGNKKGTIVRLVITQEERKSSFFTKAKDKIKADDLTKANPQIYQAFFSKIDKELFIRRATR